METGGGWTDTCAPFLTCKPTEADSSKPAQELLSTRSFTLPTAPAEITGNPFSTYNVAQGAGAFASSQPYPLRAASAKS
ncbi:hypothetical protein AGOR_G00218190 [Albula goreensis]|uniref:Uncharacterized protein n=1 Tax=Albula goreensis TaxID=1534307 RepID=A0A8T3CLD5_9TELE|nr:hypothetical protein AGOR_G00218190 [Albula goreensis]